MVCSDCYPGTVGAFAPLKEICPDRATSELMELTAQLGGVMSYRQAANVPSKFLPVEPAETHATVRKRTIRVGERIDDQVAKEEWLATREMEERHQLEMPLAGDRRKEFVISIDTAHVRSAEPDSARSFEILRPDAVAVVGVMPAAAISLPPAQSRRRSGIELGMRFDGRGIAVMATSPCSRMALKSSSAFLAPCRNRQLILSTGSALPCGSSPCSRSRTSLSQPDLSETLSSIDREITAMKWRLWHGRVDRAIRDLGGLLARLKSSQQEGVFSLARLHSLGSQL